VLLDEYKNSLIKNNILSFKNNYHFQYYRPVRGDGNCFYRSITVWMVELFLYDYSYCCDFRNMVEKSFAENIIPEDVNKSVLFLLGYIMDQFHQNQVNEIKESITQMNDDSTLIKILNEVSLMRKEIGELKYQVNIMKDIILCGFLEKDDLSSFMDKKDVFLDDWFNMSDPDGHNVSDYLVLCLRYFTYHYIVAKMDKNFINDSEEEVKEKTLTMGTDAEHYMIVACTSFLNLKTRIFYLDKNIPTVYTFPEDGDSEVKVYLLYRPGHYDVLYIRK